MGRGQAAQTESLKMVSLASNASQREGGTEMPIYEYSCEAGHDFEVLQKIDELPIETCAVCSQKCRRTISVFNQAKRAGIYVFDRRFGGADILHDPAFSDSERAKIVAEPGGQSNGRRF